MRHSFQLTLVTAALVIAGCGGGGGGEADASSGSGAGTVPDTPIPVLPYQATLLAGVVNKAAYAADNPEPGCADGAALGAKLNPYLLQGSLARAPNGNLLLAEGGGCGDSRARIRVIDPQNNTIKTLARGSDQSAGALTTFMTPVGLAVAPSGDIYIQDGEFFSGGMQVITPR